MDVLKKVPVREQAPDVRNKNFDEVCLGYNIDEAKEEATRCINCKNAKCITGCPVSINIPAFIAQVKDGNIEEAYKIISESSALPAVCGRVCPQESQCEGKCIRGIKGEAISIGKLERFVADYARENNIKPVVNAEKKNKKVAVIGSGPSGLTCAGDLAKMGYDVTIFEALHEAGGVLVYGIPEFRLPKKTVVASEIENVKALGVKIETNVIIGKSLTIDQLLEEEDFDAVLNINLKGTFNTIRHSARQMLKQRSGKIINISSVSGILGNPGQANYAASKAGVIGLTKTMARELGSRGITVNAIAPGFVDTEMTEVLGDSVKEAACRQIILGRFGKPEDIANTAVFLASEKADYITGQVISVDGGMNV